MVFSRFYVSAVLLGSLLFPGLASSAGDVLEDAARLLATGDSRGAYDLLAQEESRQAGITRYDLLLGRAALETGQNTRAIFALQRVLHANPDDRQARIDMGRAHLASGDLTAATQAFEYASKLEPQRSDPVLADYLLRAKRSEVSPRPNFSGFGELRIGYDTNANAGPNRNAIDLPGLGLGPVVLGNEQQASDDAFAGLAAGGRGRVPVSDQVTLLGDASVSLRIHHDENRFDFASYDARAGVELTQGRTAFSVLGHYSGLNIDDHGYRSLAGLTGQWQHDLDARNRVAAYLQFSDVRYDQQSSRDADRWVLGGRYNRRLNSAWQASMDWYWGRERADHSALSYLGLDTLGLRLGVQGRWINKTDVFAQLSYESRRNKAVDPAYLVRREDQQFGLTIGARYLFAPAWTLTPVLMLINNQSNTDAHEYHREIMSFVVRRDF